MPQLSEKPRLGFATKKTAWNPGPNVCNFRVSLGLQVVVNENGIREIYSARYYNPATGRFLSRDPEDGKVKDPASLHKYLYAGGNPVNMIDPTGRGDLFETALIEGGSKLSTTEIAVRVYGYAIAKAFCFIADYLGYIAQNWPAGMPGPGGIPMWPFRLPPIFCKAFGF